MGTDRSFGIISYQVRYEIIRMANIDKKVRVSSAKKYRSIREIFEESVFYAHDKFPYQFAQGRVSTSHSVLGED